MGPRDVAPPGSVDSCRTPPAECGTLGGANPGGPGGGGQEGGSLPPAQQGERAEGRGVHPSPGFPHLGLPRASSRKVCPPVAASDD